MIVPKYTLTLFVIYTIAYECIIWGLVASSIYYLQWSEWTVLPGIYMSSAQLKLKHFTIQAKKELNNGTNN